MLLIQTFFSFFQNNIALLLTSSVIFLTIVYFSNYIRLFYYVSKLPGPRAYPIVGNILMLLGSHEEMAESIFQLLKKYFQEDLARIWIGPLPIVAIFRPKHVQEILNNPHALEKPWIMTHVVFDLPGDSILNSKVAKWKHNRSIVVRGFTPALLKSYFKVFVEKILILSEKLTKEKNSEKSFDIFERILRTTLDAVCASTMGVNINAQESDATYYNAVQSAFCLMFDRFLHPWEYFNFIFNLTQNGKQLKECKEVILGLANEIIAEKRNKNQFSNNNNVETLKDIGKNVLRKPLLDHLIDITQNDLEFTDQQLRDESTLVILAGYETTANALSYTLLNLATHKNIQRQVFDELLTVFGDSNRPVELQDLPELKYMEMVIKESMRLYPTIPFILRELTNDIQLDEHIIPKGSTCLIPIYSLHRNPNTWNNPLEFDPERFTPENIKKRHPYAYIPFSGGPRNCIGIRYAMMFMKTLLSTLLRKYEFHTDLNMNELKFEIELSLKLVGGHQVRITPRNTN